MKTWEYMKMGDCGDWNALGAEGWELITACYSSNVSTVIGYFKRETNKKTYDVEDDLKSQCTWRVGRR
mgnify:CR=1 FL=1